MTSSSFSRKFLNPSTLHTPFSYSHIVEITLPQRIIHIAGQIALNQQKVIVGLGNLEQQAVQAFNNLAKALEAANASFDDVVKMNYYLVDISQIGLLRGVIASYFKKDRLPASTAVEVSGLAIPGLLVEIEATAITNINT